eukprot:3042156-Pleurochrysis_carterae.AAC.1
MVVSEVSTPAGAAPLFAAVADVAGTRARAATRHGSGVRRWSWRPGRPRIVVAVAAGTQLAACASRGVGCCLTAALQAASRRRSNASALHAHWATKGFVVSSSVVPPRSSVCACASLCVHTRTPSF